MLDPTLPVLAASASVLTTVYWASAIVGAGLILVSVMGGSGSEADVDIDVDVGVDVDVDVSADVDADVDADVAHHADGVAADASSLATWFSIRFLVFFLAVFGVLGVVLTHMTQAGVWAGFGVSAVGGLAAGQAVHQLFRTLRRSSGNSTPRAEDYVNKIARVTIPIEHPAKGEIVLSVRGGQRYIPAVTKHADTVFKVGDEVAVVTYRGGAAEVVSRKEFEFLSATQ